METEIFMHMAAFIGPTPPGTGVEMNITEQTRFAIVHCNARLSSEEMREPDKRVTRSGSDATIDQHGLIFQV
jgi:hypothetical protein